MRFYVLFLVLVFLLSVFGCVSSPAQKSNFSAVPIPVSNSSQMQNLTPCSSVYLPVCANDSNTYSNSCLAQLAGVSVVSVGTCPPVTFCNSSGASRDLGLRGYVNDNAGLHADSCASSLVVTKYSCSGGRVLNMTLPCPSNEICRDGICLPAPSGVVSGCVDNGTGNNLYVRGFVTLNGVVQQDLCETLQVVKKFSCLRGAISNTNYACAPDYMCDLGVCVKAPKTCTDSHVGILPYSSGNVIITTNNYQQTFRDSCSGWTLTEYYCNANDAASRVINCNNGCDNGACDSDGCIASDPTNSIFISGNVSVGATLNADRCTDLQDGIKYYCSGNVSVSRFFSCPSNYQCQNGSCVSRQCNASADTSIYSPGFVTVDGQTYANHCNADNITGVQYGCSGGYLDSGPFTCPAGYRCVTSGTEAGSCALN